MNAVSVLNLRLPPALSQWLREQAHVNRRSINSQAIAFFEEVQRSRAADPQPHEGAASPAAQQ